MLSQHRRQEQRERKKGWRKGVGVKWGGRWGREEGEVNNECSRELLRPWRGLGACRTGGLVTVRASGHLQHPPAAAAVSELDPQTPSTHLLLLAPSLSAPALQDLRDISSCSLRFFLTEYISRSVHLFPPSPPLFPRPAPVPSSGKAHFWFPYKSWLWSVEVTWSHYSSSMRATRGDSEWNCDSLGCPQRCQESKIVTILFLWKINDAPSAVRRGLNRYGGHTMRRSCVKCFYFPL